MIVAFFGFFFLGLLYLECVFGYGLMEIGFVFLLVVAVMAVFSIWLSARLIMRFGSVTILVVGQLVVAVALVMLGLGPVRFVYFVHLLASLAMFGLGGGLSFSAFAILAISD